MFEPTQEWHAPTAPVVPQPVAQRPAPGKRTSTIVFAALAVVFLLAATVMTVLYVSDKRAADKTIADQKAQIVSLQSEVTKVKSDLDKTNKDLAAAKADAEKNAACAQPVKDFFAALKVKDDAKGRAAVMKMASACGVPLG